MYQSSSTSSDQQFLDSICGDFTLPKESHALVFHEGHSTAAVHVQFQLTISFLNCMFVVARLCFARGLLHVMYPLLRFVPPYSPDLNPIELAFSKVKAFLKANDRQLMLLVF